MDEEEEEVDSGSLQVNLAAPFDAKHEIERKKIKVTTKLQKWTRHVNRILHNKYDIVFLSLYISSLSLSLYIYIYILSYIHQHIYIYYSVCR